MSQPTTPPGPTPPGPTPPGPPAPDARLDRWVQLTRRPLDVLALVFLVDLLLIWSFPDAPDPVPQILAGVSWLVWGAFAVDYVARVWLAADRRAFVRSHKLDLLMVAVPMLRLLRVALIVRRSLSAVSTEKIASSIVSIAVVVVLVAAWLEWRIEYDAPGATITTFREGIWWAVVTTTTVGYGDYTPVTPQGRLVGMVVMMVGVGLIGTVSATVATWFIDRRPGRRRDEEPSGDEPSGEPATTANPVDAQTLMGRLDALAAEQAEIRAALQRIEARG